MSRTTDYTEEIADRVCAELMDGKSLRKICSAADMPDRVTVHRWLSADEVFATKYARARVIQADALEEAMSDIEDETLNGLLDPAAARVVIASKQWRAAKLAPKRYGDKLAIGGADDLPSIKTDGTLTIDPAEAYKRMLGG